MRHGAGGNVANSGVRRGPDRHHRVAPQAEKASDESLRMTLTKDGESKMSSEQFETTGPQTSRASITAGSGDSDLLYVGFWKRLAAYALDFAIFLPYGIGVRHLIYSNKYALLGNFAVTSIFGLVFWVYLVKRFGGSPGKLLMRIKIVKIDGGAVGYREAILRYLVLFTLSTASSAALVL